ncbi:MAG TPA: NAD(P)H-dependent oxidoreductase subunit E [Clostridia bacterium]
MLLKTLNKEARKSENILNALLEYQKSKDTNYISEEELAQLAEELGITESRAYSIITFYSLFSTKPRGKYIIQVCNDVPCYVNGSTNILEELEDYLEIRVGGTTHDGVFSLERTSCLGCCNMSPAIRIGEKIYGNLTKDDVPRIISEYRRKYYEEV